jgi:hypothetical protein
LPTISDLIRKGQADLVLLIEQTAVEAAGGYFQYGQSLARTVERLMRNNPLEPIESIFQRVSVQQAIARFNRASAAADRLVARVFSLGSVLGSSAIRVEAFELGLRIAPRISLLGQTSYVNSVLQDMQMLSFRVPSMLWAAARIPTPGTDRGQYASTVALAIRNESRKMAQRVSAAATAAANRGFNEGALVEMQQVIQENPARTILKLWLCTLSANSCPTCVSLHGTVLQVTEEFTYQTSESGRTVYHNLLTPPRHPACRCRVGLSVR